MRNGFEPNYLQFKDKTVRELAWVIASPPLLQDNLFLSYDWFVVHYKASLSFLILLDENPGALHLFIREKQSKRLGKYFENLLEFWFLYSPNFDLLVSNWQIIEGKHTLGEIDFIVYDHLYGKFFHFEVAIKFYLQHESGREFIQWIGPNTRDRLAFKYRKLTTQQLTILDRAETKTKVEEQLLDMAPQNVEFSRISLDNIAKKCILKGFFFYSDLESKLSPKGFHPFHLRGLRLYFTEFVESTTGYFFLLVEKGDWFSIQNPLFEKLMNYSKARLLVLERMAVLPNPFMLVAFDELGKESHRLMIVPNSWPEFSF